MGKFKVEILPAAWDDLTEIAEYIALDNAAAAERTADKIIFSLRRLEQFPLSAPSVPDNDLAKEGYRVLICDKYRCFYRFIENTVFIYHIVHGARNYPVLLKNLDNKNDESN